MDVPVERRAAVTFLSGGVQRFVVEAVLHAHPTFIISRVNRLCQLQGQLYTLLSIRRWRKVA